MLSDAIYPPIPTHKYFVLERNISYRLIQIASVAKEKTIHHLQITNSLSMMSYGKLTSAALLSRNFL
jgi:hypothetical protein